jgi:hypothetical protein
MLRNKILIATLIISSIFCSISFCQKSNVSYSDTVLFTHVDMGLGVGYDYGGFLGLKCMIYPRRNLQLFGSLAYLYSTAKGTGYSFGCKMFLPFRSEKVYAFAPYIFGMYGTNAQVLVSNASYLNSSFNGFSTGIGIDLHPAQLKNGAKFIRNSGFFNRLYVSYSVILPFRASSVNNYREYLKNTYNIVTSNPFPISGSIGLSFKLF